MLLITAGVLYMGVPFEWLTGSALDPSRSFLSELAAADQPHHVLFRTLDVLAAILTFMALLIMRRPRWCRLLPIGRMGLGLFALGTFFDAMFPMTCAVSASASCAAADAAGQFGAAEQIHLITSMLAGLGPIITAVCLTLAVRKGTHPGTWRMITWVSTILLLVATAASSIITAASLDQGALPAGGGYAQRAQIALVSVLLMIFVSVVQAATQKRNTSAQDSTHDKATERPQKVLATR